MEDGSAALSKANKLNCVNCQILFLFRCILTSSLGYYVNVLILWFELECKNLRMYGFIIYWYFVLFGFSFAEEPAHWTWKNIMMRVPFRLTTFWMRTSTLVLVCLPVGKMNKNQLGRHYCNGILFSTLSRVSYSNLTLCDSSNEKSLLRDNKRQTHEVKLFASSSCVSSYKCAISKS